MALPTPHLEKLKAALANEKLPANDRAVIEATVERYGDWIDALAAIESGREETLPELVALLTDYRLFVDLNAIFDSPDDFLYRQKGQLKLDNSVIEEFLPHLVAKMLPKLAEQFDMGPRSCFSALYFSSSLSHSETGGGPLVRVKDQDFAISRPLFLRSSHDAAFAESVSQQTHIGLICAECKTNLDKTMFQEAAATAHDVKTAVPGAKYFLLCEWLDMTPVSTAATDIDEVLILRKSKRMGSHLRKRYGSAAGRKSAREEHELFLRSNPFAVPVFARFIGHIASMFEDTDPSEDSVLEKGYF